MVSIPELPESSVNDAEAGNAGDAAEKKKSLQKPPTPDGNCVTQQCQTKKVAGATQENVEQQCSNALDQEDKRSESGCSCEENSTSSTNAKQDVLAETEPDIETDVTAKNTTLTAEETKEEKKKDQVKNWTENLVAGKKRGVTLQEAYKQQLSAADDIIDSLIETGYQGMYQCECLSGDLKIAKEELTFKEKESKRLRWSIEMNQMSTVSMTKALDSVKTQAREYKDFVKLEAGLKAELEHEKKLRDEVSTEAAQAKRKLDLLEEKFRNVKTKLETEIRAKRKLEKETKETLGLVRSIKDGNKNDSSRSASHNENYYRRKVTDMKSRLQALQETSDEQKEKMDDICRQVERSMSQVSQKKRIAH